MIGRLSARGNAPWQRLIDPWTKRTYIRIKFGVMLLILRVVVCIDLTLSSLSQQAYWSI
ncbi:hypothetical protein Plhal304r1_c046g0128171 [Plasmopara halstedii]